MEFPKPWGTSSHLCSEFPMPNASEQTATALVPNLTALVRIAAFLAVFLTSGQFSNGKLLADEPSEAAARLTSDLTFLASDELAGRGVGSEGIAQAGDFIAKRFQELGFQTDAFEGTAFQPFGIPGPISLGDPQHNSLSVQTKAATDEALKLGSDFNPLTLGRNGEFSGQVVFAGYGITAKELGYDDYAAVDSKGKVVLVLRKEPQQDNPSSVFDGKENSQYAFFTAKELNAAMHGVAAMILVNDAVSAEATAAKYRDDLKRAQTSLEELKQQAAPQDPAELERLQTRLRIAEQSVESIQAKINSNAGDVPLAIEAGGTALTNETVPTLVITRQLADQWIRAGCGRSLSDLERAIDETGKPQSIALDGVNAKGETDLKSKETPVRNVIALLPGAGSLKDEYVVVGAHYDHVGMGGMGSLAPGTIAVHNGADDNGSGTVTMLEVARQLSTLKSDNRRSIIFMAFTAEESGLLGSAHYVRNPRWPLEKTVAMINLDMVGRLLNDELTIYGTGTASEFPAIIDRLNTKFNFKVVKVPQGRGASDHANFYNARIPVFHFFTGLHNEYHRPSDDVGLINVVGMERISRMVADLTREIVETPARPNYLEIKGSAAPRTQSGARRAVIGIQVDRELTAPAVVQAVVDGGPASEAGMLAGDTIVSINNNAVNNLGDFRSEMAKLKPGQTVPIGFKRGENTQTVDVKLAE